VYIYIYKYQRERERELSCLIWKHEDYSNTKLSALFSLILCFFHLETVYWRESIAVTWGRVQWKFSNSRYEPYLNWISSRLCIQMVNWLDWQDSFLFRYLTKRSHKRRFVSHTCLKSTRKQGSKVLNNGRELTGHESIHFSHMHHLDVLNHVQRETHPKFAHFFFKHSKPKALSCTVPHLVKVCTPSVWKLKGTVRV